MAENQVFAPFHKLLVINVLHSFAFDFAWIAVGSYAIRDVTHYDGPRSDCDAPTDTINGPTTSVLEASITGCPCISEQCGESS